MPAVKSLNQLDKIIQPYIIKAMEMTRDEIFNIISQKVEEYYNEPVFNEPDTAKPDVYDRTYELKKSLDKSHIIQNGNVFSFTVGWEDNYLTFRYPGNAYLTNDADKVTGLDILNWMDNKSHGGTVPGKHRFFQEAFEELGEEYGIKELFKNNLKASGLPMI